MKNILSQGYWTTPEEFGIGFDDSEGRFGVLCEDYSEGLFHLSAWNERGSIGDSGVAECQVEGSKLRVEWKGSVTCDGIAKSIEELIYQLAQLCDVHRGDLDAVEAELTKRVKAFAPNTRTVTVIDRAAQARNWGYGNPSIHSFLRKITLVWEGRGEPVERQFYEDGENYVVCQWSREDGKIDLYENVLREARTNGLNPQLSRA